jgi:hypothetical protein
MASKKTTDADSQLSDEVIAAESGNDSATAASPVPDAGQPVDEFFGHGGSYTVDADTQTRRPNK